MSQLQISKKSYILKSLMYFSLGVIATVGGIIAFTNFQTNKNQYILSLDKSFDFDAKVMITSTPFDHKKEKSKHEFIFKDPILLKECEISLNLFDKIALIDKEIELYTIFQDKKYSIVEIPQYNAKCEDDTFVSSSWYTWNSWNGLQKESRTAFVVIEEEKFPELKVKYHEYISNISMLTKINNIFSYDAEKSKKLLGIQ